MRIRARLRRLPASNQQVRVITAGLLARRGRGSRDFIPPGATVGASTMEVAYPGAPTAGAPEGGAGASQEDIPSLFWDALEGLPPGTPNPTAPTDTFALTDMYAPQPPTVDHTRGTAVRAPAHARGSLAPLHTACSSTCAAVPSCCVILNPSLRKADPIWS